jgi:hypothetical protein
MHLLVSYCTGVVRAQVARCMGWHYCGSGCSSEILICMCAHSELVVMMAQYMLQPCLHVLILPTCFLFYMLGSIPVESSTR